MDRLLGNKHLPQEIPMIYMEINRLIINKSSPVMSVDSVHDKKICHARAGGQPFTVWHGHQEERTPRYTMKII